VRVTAKADYAVRATIELALAKPGTPVKGDQLAKAQGIPVKFLENILSELKHAGIVSSQRGADGGYWLAKPPASVSVADVIRAVEGPLAGVRGTQPQDVAYGGTALPLQRVWIAVRASLRSVLERVTLADLTADELPPDIEAMARDPDSWLPR
jgi:Rrf2 family protein